MIEFNLLPEELKVSPKKIKAPRIKVKIPDIPWQIVISATVASFILVHLSTSLLLIAQRNNLLKLTKKYASAALQEKEAQKLKEELNSLNKRFLVIESLTSGSLLWSKKLHDLSETIVEGVWLTSLELKREMQHSAYQPPQPSHTTESADASTPRFQKQSAEREIMVLTGSVISFVAGEGPAIVGKFINSLKAHKEFSSSFDDIKLSSIETRKIEKTEIMDFIIKCYFKQGRSYFERLETATI